MKYAALFLFLCSSLSVGCQGKVTAKRSEESLKRNVCVSCAYTTVCDEAQLITCEQNASGCFVSKSVDCASQSQSCHPTGCFTPKARDMFNVPQDMSTDMPHDMLKDMPIAQDMTMDASGDMPHDMPCLLYTSPSPRD